MTSDSPPAEQPVVLVVDDVDSNLRLIQAVLEPRGYRVVTASSGHLALELLSHRDVDLVLLDLLMPGMDGNEVCRRIRADERTAYLPVVMVTAIGKQERVRALEAGADDFITKPFDSAELLARIRSLVRINRYHRTVQSQAEQLARWNTELTARVAAQVDELERASRLRRFLTPQVAELVLSTGDDEFLQGHRRNITVLVADLRGFTHFAETAEPEEVWDVLRQYHETFGALVTRYEATLEGYTGDGITVFFNDPVPMQDGTERAVRMSLDVREQVRALSDGWRRRGFELSLGMGLAEGFATLGRIGFEGRFDYAAIGTVMNVAARLCAAAAPWQVLATPRVQAAVEGQACLRLVGELELKGISRPVPTFEVVELTGT